MHRSSDATRPYLPRKNGGRGLINITSHYKNAVINFSSYLLNSEEHLLKTVSDWEFTRGDKSLHSKASNYCNELNLDYEVLRRTTKQQRKAKIKNARVQLRNDEFSRKQAHGQLTRYLNEPHIDKVASMSWLKSSTLKRSTEATICAVQEQAITTKYMQKHIHHTSDSDICRLCKHEKETIHHIISGCETLAPTKYLQRHDNLCKYIHTLLMHKHELSAELELWYGTNIAQKM